MRWLTSAEWRAQGRDRPGGRPPGPPGRAPQPPGRPPRPTASRVTRQVRVILAEVARRGDAALREYTRRFDGVDLETVGLAVSAAERRAASQVVPPETRRALAVMAARLEDFHRRQRPPAYSFRDAWGNLLGRAVRPLERVGIYVPGGSAAYPSTVLMAAIPARLAGVEEIALCTPPRSDGTVPAPVLLAAQLAGVERIFRVGGAQAIAALAYGTETVPRVDKIVGPGNRYVTEAKRQVYGLVGIDGLAGPSEVAIVAGPEADPRWVTLDLLAQAEHDSEALAVLFTPAVEVAEEVLRQLERELEKMPRAAIARAAWESGGAVVVTKDVAEAVELADGMAPEHLSLHLQDAATWLSQVRRAGAVFLGPWTPVAGGDYALGPNHILPTGGTARFASALGVEDFLRYVNYAETAPAGTEAWALASRDLAAAEGLPGHAASAEARLVAAGSGLPRLEGYRGGGGARYPESSGGRDGALRLDANENPYPWPSWLLEEVWEVFRREGPARYPRRQKELQEAVAAYAGVPPDWVAVGNGSDELIQVVLGSLGRRVERVLLPRPTFYFYRVMSEALDLRARFLDLEADFSLPLEKFLEAVSEAGESLVVLCRPHNPTGGLFPREAVLALAERGAWVLVDEAYYEFAGDTVRDLLEGYPRLMILRTLSKAFGLAGLRVGYALARPEVTERWRKLLQPYNVGNFSQAAALTILRYPGVVRRWVADIRAAREELRTELAGLPGLRPYPSQANFLLVEVNARVAGWRAAELVTALREREVRVRYWAEEPRLQDFFRVSVGLPRENDLFLGRLRALLEEGRVGTPRRREE